MNKGTCLYELNLAAAIDSGSKSAAAYSQDQDTAAETKVVRATQSVTMQALQAVADMDAELFPGNVWGLSAYSKSAEQDYDYLIVSADGDIITGFALLRCMDDAELIRIAVSPAYRRQGIGRQLLNALIEEIYRRDIHSIFLEVRSSNTAALDLYESAGFSKVGVRKAYYAAPIEDAIIMRYTW